MCGIFGIYSPRGNATRNRAEAAVARLTHRGPDDQGTWQSVHRKVCLGHSRLGLISLENGHQPALSENRNIVAVVNGEFYGYRALRQRLERQGHRFQLDSDSEIALHLYEQHGLNFVDYLNGEFSLLLWDECQQRLIAVRDRFGVKPLAYTVDHERSVLFASETKALLPEILHRSWDIQSLF